jgi:hypothetical protein
MGLHFDSLFVFAYGASTGRLLTRIHGVRMNLFGLCIRAGAVRSWRAGQWSRFVGHIKTRRKVMSECLWKAAARDTCAGEEKDLRVGKTSGMSVFLLPMTTRLANPNLAVR